MALFLITGGNMAVFAGALESLLAIRRNNGVDGGAIDAVKAHAAQLEQATVDGRPRLLAHVGEAVMNGLHRAGKSVKEMADLYEAYDTLAKAMGMAAAVIVKFRRLYQDNVTTPFVCKSLGRTQFPESLKTMALG
jgi:hypothetical protein